jgi:predicted protein tyrosine phosphatase
MTDRVTRILTVCQGGNVRSVMARFLLNYKYGFDALACGWEPNTDETKTMLYEWADIIIPMHDDFAAKIPEQFRSKIRTTLHLGDDVWGLNSDLLNKTDALIGQWFESQVRIQMEDAEEAEIVESSD